MTGDLFLSFAFPKVRSKAVGNVVFSLKSTITFQTVYVFSFRSLFVGALMNLRA